MGLAMVAQKEVELEADELDVLIIGAGFGGLYQLDRFRQMGLKVKVFEAGGDIGGTWYWNCYPGARVDTDGHLYQFSNEKLWRDWDFNERFPSWEELRGYFRHVDEKLDLSRDISFNTRVSEARFDNDTNRWRIAAEDGTVVSAKFFVLCTGFVSKPYVPAFEGIDTFQGESYHTGTWPQGGVDPVGKRIGVIGTGASGIQVIQEWHKSAATITAFQRTPNIALPMQQKVYDDETKRRLKEKYAENFRIRNTTFSGTDYDFLPRASNEATAEERTTVYEELWALGGFRCWVGNFNDILVDEDANNMFYAFWRDKTRARIKDPRIAELLAPTHPIHPFGTKRPSLEQNYYEAYNNDNVSLIDLRETPITRITPKGVMTSDGVEHELDMIVFATGFDAVTGSLVNIDIRGSDGTSLKEAWADGAQAHLGMATSNFPNLLFTNGPQSLNALCIGPTCAELQGDWIADFVKHMQDNGIERFDVAPGADQAWSNHVNEIAEQSLFPRAESWYMGANIPGKKRQFLSYPAGLQTYVASCRTSADNGYEGFVLTAA